MTLSVGILNPSLHWDELLKQVGVSVKKITAGDPLHTFPVVIINKFNDDQKNYLAKYLSDGGSVIAGSTDAKKLFNISFKKKKIEYIYSKPDDVFNFPLYSDINSLMQVPAGANYLQCNEGSYILLIKEIDKGTLVVLPDNLTELVSSFKSRRKIFYSAHGKEYPTEKVSQTDKHGVYKIIYRVLEYLFYKKNLPFTRLWQLPDGNQTLFGFRIDTDFANDEDIYNLYDTLTKNKIKATWFIETMSRKKNFSLFSNFTEQEIALHCYRHKIYNSRENNIKDIEYGNKLLSENGFSPSGYAAPFGELNESLAESIDKLKFHYSSEFAYLYDSFPVHPLINDVKSVSLQIPIHPVSVGRLNIAGHSNDDMIKYYTDIINLKRNAYEPIFLYTHPSQKRLDVFNVIFKIINELNISSRTFNDFAEWWKNRETVKWNPEITDHKILYNTKGKTDSVWIHTSFMDGKNLLVNTKDMSVKEIGPVQYNLLPGFNVELFNKFKIKLFKQKILYNYQKLKY